MPRQPRLVRAHQVPLVPGIRTRFLRRRRGVALGRDLPAIPSPLLRPRSADQREQQLAQHPPAQGTVTLRLTDDRFLRSATCARWQLGIPLPMD